MESFSKKLASRRFIVTMFGIIAATALVYAGKIDAMNYENIMVWLTGIYVVGRPVGDRLDEFLNKPSEK